VDLTVTVLVLQGHSWALHLLLADLYEQQCREMVADWQNYLPIHGKTPHTHHGSARHFPIRHDYESWIQICLLVTSVPGRGRTVYSLSFSCRLLQHDVNWSFPARMLAVEAMVMMMMMMMMMMTSWLQLRQRLYCLG
jgi:hypothetical protein